MSSIMRLSGECPECGGTLVRRESKARNSVFIGCRSYPRCNFTDSYDPHLDGLANELAALRRRVEDLERNPPKQPSATRLPAEVAKELRAVIAFAHPDRWPTAGDLAHGVTTRLNAMRDRIK